MLLDVRRVYTIIDIKYPVETQVIGTPKVKLKSIVHSNFMQDYICLEYPMHQHSISVKSALGIGYIRDRQPFE